MNDPTNLEGHLLIAMPGIGDRRFERSVICVCQHNRDGAMGLIINRNMNGLSFIELLEQLSVTTIESIADRPLYTGGPMETGRGFVLHSDELILKDGTRKIADGIALSANIEILQSMANGLGPRRALVCLGYAGWSPGQLDREMADNIWLSVEATPSLIFGTPNDQKWPKSLAALGVDAAMLSGQAGHA